MTLAAAAPSSQPILAPHTVPVVILGTDAVLAAAPATPIQLAHACLAAGFASVIPASWGDELIASAVLRQLREHGDTPAIQCSCPIVAHRLLSAGGDLRNALVALVAPPVAVARYVRASAHPTPTRITYVGACPGANDDAIDIRMHPAALFAMLAERRIVVEEQPRVFESIIPPDRRRFQSQPGGVPTAEALWSVLGGRSLVDIDGDDVVGDVAQHLLGGKNVLIDVSSRLGCACAGASAASAGRDGRTARESVIALEPPRAPSPVVDDGASFGLDLPLPAAPRSPIDVAALSAMQSAVRSQPVPQLPSAQSGNAPVRSTPGRGLSAPEMRASRMLSPATARAVIGALPVGRDPDGKSLPRAYIARRRSSPKGIAALALPGASEDVVAELPTKRTSTAVRRRVVHSPVEGGHDGGRLATDGAAPDGVAPDRIAPDRIAPDGIAPDATLDVRPTVAPVSTHASTEAATQTTTPAIPRAIAPAHEQPGMSKLGKPASKLAHASVPAVAAAGPSVAPAARAAFADATRAPSSPPDRNLVISQKQLIAVIGGTLLIAVTMSVAIGVVVGHSMRQPVPAAAP